MRTPCLARSARNTTPVLRLPQSCGACAPLNRIVQKHLVDDQRQSVLARTASRAVCAPHRRIISRRIIRMHQHNRARSFSNRSPKCVEVDRPRMRRNSNAPDPRKPRIIAQWILPQLHRIQSRNEIEQRIARPRDQHLISRIAQQPEQIAVGLARARRQAEMSRPEPPLRDRDSTAPRQPARARARTAAAHTQSPRVPPAGTTACRPRTQTRTPSDSMLSDRRLHVHSRVALARFAVSAFSPSSQAVSSKTSSLLASTGAPCLQSIQDASDPRSSLRLRPRSQRPTRSRCPASHGEHPQHHAPGAARSLLALSRRLRPRASLTALASGVALADGSGPSAHRRRTCTAPRSRRRSLDATQSTHDRLGGLPFRVPAYSTGILSNMGDAMETGIAARFPWVARLPALHLFTSSRHRQA